MNNKKLKVLLALLLSVVLIGGCTSNSVAQANTTSTLEEVPQYYFPHEGIEHEGTWLQWPHDNTYKDVIHYYEPIWIEMTRALIKRRKCTSNCL